MVRPLGDLCHDIGADNGCMSSSLASLKKKWFLDVHDDNPARFPPTQRHPHALVSPATDGNLLKLLPSGAAMMKEFHDRVSAMIASGDPSANSLWISSWKIQPTRLLGEGSDSPTAEDLIIAAARSGVDVRWLGSGHFGSNRSAKNFAGRLAAAGGLATSDRRFPRFASHHQKFNVFRGPGDQWSATIGSGDFLKARWDTMSHEESNSARHRGSGPTHEAFLRVEGPAVHDLALHFAERWNDDKNLHRTAPSLSAAVPTAFPDQPLPAVGPHAVQVLRTYGIDPDRGHSWADTGEFTIWAAYLNAIDRASVYLYLEDQYFYTFQDPPLVDHDVAGRLTDVTFRLGEALRRGVDVVILVPSRKGQLFKHYEIQQRRRAAEYLRHIADSQPGAGRFVFTHLRTGRKDPAVHSKLLLADDEYAIIGSANIGQRSMTCDSEIAFGVVDEAEDFIRHIRTGLWSIHMWSDERESLAEPRDAVTRYYDHARCRTGRLRLRSTSRLPVELPYRFVMNQIIDPYRGPERG